MRIGALGLSLVVCACGRGERARPAPSTSGTVDAALVVDAAPLDARLFAGAAGVCDWEPPEPDPARWDINLARLGPLPACTRPTGDDVIARFAGLPGYTVTTVDDREFGTLYVVAQGGEPLIRVQPTRDKYYWGAEIVSPRLLTERRYQYGTKVHLGMTLAEVHDALDDSRNGLYCSQDELAAGGLVECGDAGGEQSPIPYRFRFAQPAGAPPRDCLRKDEELDLARCADLRLTSILWDDIQAK